MSQLTYARETTSPFRLVNWIVEFGDRQENERPLTFKELYRDRTLLDGGEGLFEILRYRLGEASAVTDDCIEPRDTNAEASPFIESEKAITISNCILNYESGDAASASLTMADLFEGKNLDPANANTYDYELDTLLNTLAHLGIYWPSNHARPNHGRYIAQTLRDEGFWGKLLFESNDEGPSLHLGNTTFRDLFTRSKITAEGRVALNFLKDEGVIRPHTGWALMAN